MNNKKKFFRFLPLLGGLIALLISFIASIPFGSLVTISFHLLESGGIYQYIWGIVEGDILWFGFTTISIDNLIPLILWILLVFSAISGFIGASYKENPKTIKKLLIIAGLTVSLEFAYFTVLLILNIGSYTLGIGYYALILIFILYFLSAGLVTDYQKI